MVAFAPMIRRLSAYRGTFADDDPVVFILAPAPDRAVPAGDTRRGTAWIFRSIERAIRFATWVRERHGITTVPLAVRLRELNHALIDRDLTWVLDPQPTLGYGNPLSFKAPMEN